MDTRNRDWSIWILSALSSAVRCHTSGLVQRRQTYRCVCSGQLLRLQLSRNSTFPNQQENPSCKLNLFPVYIFSKVLPRSWYANIAGYTLLLLILQSRLTSTDLTDPRFFDKAPEAQTIWGHDAFTAIQLFLVKRTERLHCLWPPCYNSYYKHYDPVLHSGQY